MLLKCNFAIEKILATHLSNGINWSTPSATYTRQWTGSALVQIMAIAYSGPSHYLNQWVLSFWPLGTNFSGRSIIKTFIHENVFQNVCELAAILFRGEISYMDCPGSTGTNYKKTQQIWRHDMETCSILLALCHRWIPLTKGQWCWALAHPLMSSWRNSLKQ